MPPDLKIPFCNDWIVSGVGHIWSIGINNNSKTPSNDDAGHKVCFRSASRNLFDHANSKLISKERFCQHRRPKFQKYSNHYGKSLHFLKNIYRYLNKLFLYYCTMKILHKGLNPKSTTTIMENHYLFLFIKNCIISISCFCIII